MNEPNDLRRRLVSYSLITCGVLGIVGYVGVCCVAITLWATASP